MGDGTVVQAYRFALDPTPAQEAELRSHCGGQRFAFNWGLARVKANLDQRGAEKSYDIPDDQLTPSLSWSAYGLRKDWNQAKNALAPWWGENSKEAYSSGLANLARALKNWDEGRTGKRPRPKGAVPQVQGGSGPGCRAGCPPARWACQTVIGGMCSSRASVWFARTSPHARSPDT